MCKALLFICDVFQTENLKVFCSNKLTWKTQVRCNSYEILKVNTLKHLTCCLTLRTEMLWLPYHKHCHLGIMQACFTVSALQALIIGCYVPETMWRLVDLHMQMDLLLVGPDTRKWSWQIKVKFCIVCLEWRANLSSLCTFVGVGIWSFFFQICLDDCFF